MRDQEVGSLLCKTPWVIGLTPMPHWLLAKGQGWGARLHTYFSQTFSAHRSHRPYLWPR